jgi:hypothetical protein
VAGETRQLPAHDDQEENENNRMLRLLLVGFRRNRAVGGDEDQDTYDEEGYEHEDGENQDDDGEQGDRDWEVYSTGSTPCARQMEDEEFWEEEEKEGEGDNEYDPIPSLSLRGHRRSSRRYLRGLVSEGTVC